MWITPRLRAVLGK
jgi:hypothetical protein